MTSRGEMTSSAQVHVGEVTVDQRERLLLYLCDHHLQELSRTLGECIGSLRLRRARDRRGEDVLAAQGHLQTCESHRSQQFIVVDFSQSRTTVLVLRCVAMVFDAKTA